MVTSTQILLRVHYVLQYRNTPLQDLGVSPAQLLYGRQLRDHLPSFADALKIRQEWIQLAEDRERALAQRHLRSMETYNQHTRPLQDLKIGDHVLVQNQTGNQPTRWDKTGLVTEVLPHDQYLIRMDGSGRCTLRNRRYLRHCSPFMSDPREVVPTTPTSPILIEKETKMPSTLPQPDGYTPNHDNQDVQKAVSPARHSTPPPDTSATPVAIQNLPFRLAATD